MEIVTQSQPIVLRFFFTLHGQPGLMQKGETFTEKATFQIKLFDLSIRIFLLKDVNMNNIKYLILVINKPL